MAYNPKSRENLVQYTKNKKSDVIKEISKEVALDEEQIEIIIPKKLFSGKKGDYDRFISLVKMYLKQFAADSKLEASDLLAISTLAKNQVLEDRIYDESPSIADAMTAVEKLKKENAILLKQLAATREQRVDPRAGSDVTIQDVLNHYMKNTKQALQEKMDKYKEEEKKFEKKIKTSIDEMIT